MKKTKLKKHSKQEIPKLKFVLDRVFSQAMRKYYSFYKQFIFNGKIICYTCDTIIPLDKAQVSHFISRTHHSLRWEPRNVRLCCARCNIWLNGNLTEFTLRLIDECGRAEVEWLRQEGRKIRKWTPQELQALITQYGNTKVE